MKVGKNMKEKFEKFFVSKYTFIYTCFISACTWLTWLTCCLVKGFQYEYAIDGILYIGIIVALLASYKFNENNIQKALIGSLLLFIVKSSVGLFCTNLKQQLVLEAVFFFIQTVYSIVLFVCHLLQQSDHIGSDKFVLINQGCFVLMTLQAIFAIRQAFFSGDFQVLDVTFVLAMLFTYLIVICIETRIQKYKAIRFNAKTNGKWDQETKDQAKKLFSIDVDE